MSGALARPLAAQEDSLWAKPRADFRAEFGIDSLQRRFYRPKFTFSWPLAVLGGSRAFVDVSYLQRMNGSLKGAIDYWVYAGVETKVSETVSFEASLDHLCRHLTSVFNPHVLSLNELIGRVWVRQEGLEMGFGAGPFVGSSRGFDELMLFDLRLPGLAIPELSLESELKWVNFNKFYYEAGLAVALARWAEIFFRAARYYDLPSAAYIGLRLRQVGDTSRIVDNFDIDAGLYPYYGEHKLLVLGGFRLQFLNEPQRRFFLDVDFRTPLLSGDSFFGQFYPDRMIYDLEAEYEKPLPGGLLASWFVRYDTDMPVDKAIRFRSSLSTGLVLKNQHAFDKLEKPLRFEIAAGYDFTYAYDVRVRLGALVRPAWFFPLGAEFRADANSVRQTAELKLFTTFGKDIEVRPFVGIRKVTFLAEVPPKEAFKNKLTAGVAFYKWF